MRGRGGWALAAFAAVVLMGMASWPFTVDDAFVLGRYARRIAGGLGYTMTEGPPTDGITGPLALLPALIGELAFGRPVAASKAVGLVAAGLAAGLVAWRRGWVAAALAAGGATLGVWGAGGLETGLATLALTIAALSVHAAAAEADRRGTAEEPRAPARRGSWRGAWTGGAIAALAWLRPELALASGVLLLILMRADRRAGALALALAVAGLAAVVAFRLALFGSPLPLSAQAKPPDLGNGAGYALRGAFIALGGGGLFAAWLGAREGGGAERGLFAALVAHLFALVLAGGDWMPGFRLLAPVIPLYALLAAAPIAARLSGRGRRARGAALLVGCLAIPLVNAAVQLPLVRAAGADRERGGAALAGWLAAHATRVAMVDVGYATFRAEVEVVDLGGITDPRIGRLPGGHLDKRIDPGLLRALDPDVIVLHSSVPPRIDAEGRLRSFSGYPVERRVAAMDWVQAEMHVARVIEYAPHYHYVVLARP